MEVSAHQLCDPPELQGSVVEMKRCGHGKTKLVGRHTTQVDLTQHVRVGNCSEWLNASKFCQNLLVLSQYTIGNLFASFYPSGSDHKKYENNMLSCNTLATKLVQE